MTDVGASELDSGRVGSLGKATGRWPPLGIGDQALTHESEAFPAAHQLTTNDAMTRTEIAVARHAPSTSSLL